MQVVQDPLYFAIRNSLTSEPVSDLRWGERVQRVSSPGLLAETSRVHKPVTGLSRRTISLPIDVDKSEKWHLILRQRPHSLMPIFGDWAGLYISSPTDRISSIALLLRTTPGRSA